MRKAFWPLVAAALIVAVAIHWWPSDEFVVSVVPGWHSTIFSPWFIEDLVASAILLAIAAVILAQRFGGRRRAERHDRQSM